MPSTKRTTQPPEPAAVCGSAEVVEAVAELVRERDMGWGSTEMHGAIDVLRTATLRTEASVRDDELWRCIATLSNAGHGEAAVYLDQLDHGDEAECIPRGCYYVDCKRACGICKEHPATVCEECVQLRREGRREELRAEERERCLVAMRREVDAHAKRLLAADRPDSLSSVCAAGENIERAIGALAPREGE